MAKLLWRGGVNMIGNKYVIVAAQLPPVGVTLDLRSDPLSGTAEVSNELPASHKVRRLRLEAAAPYYYDCQLQVEVQWKKGKESHKESSTYLLKWKPIVCVANRTAAEEKAAVQGTTSCLGS
ncbi:unnamed protein product [Caretta caretta]